MLCEECHENQAEILVTEVDADGKLAEKHLCKTCAAKKGYLHTKQKPLSELFTEILKEKKDGEEELCCPACGMSWADFRTTGRFGCEKCYEEFGARIESLISRIQGTTHHTGRSASKSQHESPILRDMELKRLRKELAKAIQQEKYEKAAKLRDDLKKYEERT